MYYFNLFECILYEFSIQLDEDTTYEELIHFIFELAKKDDGQLSKVYYMHYQKVIKNEQETEIVLTTMHKVKGLEFDAVIIPASYTNLCLKSTEEDDPKSIEFHEFIEEERRLLYVAYTRAKYRLLVYHGEREHAIIQGVPFAFPEDIIDQLGIIIDPGFDKYFISWGATEEGGKVFDFIEQEMKFAEKIKLEKGRNNWFLFAGDRRIACLSGSVSATLFQDAAGSRVIKRYRVSNIFKWTYAETKTYDANHPGKDYGKNWSESARERGYIYLIEFSGYGSLV